MSSSGIGGGAGGGGGGGSSGGGGIGIGDEERKKRLIAMKEGAAERERQRKLIEKEIKADQEHRRARLSGEGATSPSSPSAASSTPPSRSPSCTVQFRFPGGQTMREEFASSTAMAMVCQKAAELYDIGEEFTLVCPPNVSVTQEMMTKSLDECSFCPAVSFTVKPRSTDGVISSPPPANVEFEDAFVAEVLLFLKNDGLLAWEASQWAEGLVKAQLKRGELHPLRATLRALFGSRPLPQIVRGWAQRVDRAPRPVRSGAPTDARERLLADITALSAADAETVGLRMERCCGSKGLRLTIATLPGVSALARDLASLKLVGGIVIEISLGGGFPFTAPWIRVIQPPLMPPAQGEWRRRPSVAMESGEAAPGLDGSKTAAWLMTCGGSGIMLAAWMRNWLVGSAYRVDEAAVLQRARVVHSPPSAGGLWAEMGLEEQSKEGEGEEGDGCVEWGVDLPGSARELLTESAPSACPPSPMDDDSDAVDGGSCMTHDAGTSSGGDASDNAPMQVESAENVGGTLCRRRFTVEVTLVGGGGRAVCGVRSFQAPEGKVLIPKGLFQVGVQLGDAAVVRGVSLPCASSVCIGSEGGLANFVRQHVPELSAEIRRCRASVTAGGGLTVSVGGREVPLQVMGISGGCDSCAVAGETEFTFDVA